MAGTLRGSLDVVLLGAGVIAALFWGGFSLDVAALGVVEGAVLVPLALAAILVFRSDRIINFAVVQVGVTGSALFAQLMLHVGFIRGAAMLCPPCIPRISSLPPWALQLNFWLSIVVALLLSMALSWGAYVLVLQRFRNAPRLVMTVATLGLAQLLAGVATYIPTLFADAANVATADNNGGLVGFIGIPFNVAFPIGRTTFHVQDVAAVVAAVVAGGMLLGLLLFTKLGVAVRATADNPARAATLGTNVGGVGGLVWLIAGLLSGIAGVVTAITSGQGGGGPLSVQKLALILGAALVARFVSLPIAFAAALGFGLMDQGLFHATKIPATFQAALIGLIAILLLLQRRRLTRAESESAESWLAAREIRPVPAELLGLPPVRNYRFFGGLALAVVVLGFPFVATPGQVNLGAVILVYGLIGLSLLVLTGWAGQISLGQLAFAAIGATVTAILTASTPIPFPLPIVLGALAGGLVAVLIGIPALRLSGLNLAISTLALSLAVSNFFLDRSVLGSALPASIDRPVFFGLAFDDDKVMFFFTLLVLGLGIAAVAAMRRTRTGRALIACRDNEPAAQSLGINLFRTRLGAFGISGFMAAAAGGLLVFIQHGVQPLSFTPELSVTIFLMVVIGGMGAVAGPLLGALYLGLTLAQPAPVISFLGTGAGVLLLLLLAPGGLAQLFFAARDAFLRRAAMRYRVNVPSLLGDRGLGVGAPSPIKPNTRPGGGTIFVPQRYALEEAPAVPVTEG